MSPSTEYISAKEICDDRCCCCIGTVNSKSRRVMFQSAKNRTSSPSSTSLHQPANISSEISVSSNNFQRETSQTVCCYNINKNRSQLLCDGNSESFVGAQRAVKKLNERESIKSVHKNISQIQLTSTPKLPSGIGKSLIHKNSNKNHFSYLKDEIRKFDNPPFNIHEYNINSLTTRIRTEEERADVNPVTSVSENDQRRSGDKNSLRSTFLINHDESKSKQISSMRCSSKEFLSDGSNIKLKHSTNESDYDSSQFAGFLCECGTNNLATHRCFHYSDHIKVTKLVTKSLTPVVVECKSQVDAVKINHQPPQKQICFGDYKFNFNKVSTRSILHRSITPFDRKDLDLFCEKVNQRNERFLKIRRFSPNQFSQNLWNSTSQNRSYLNNSYYNKTLKFKNDQRLRDSAEGFSSININHLDPERLAMEKSSRNSLKKFGFGRKTSSSASASPETKSSSSKTERLKELTEKLKGHKTRATKINQSRSVSPPALPTMPISAPIPPPRKLKRNSNDISASSSFDNLLSSEPAEPQKNLYHIGKSKSVEPSSIFSRQLKSIQERFLRPNISASNLEYMSRKECLSDDKKTKSSSLKEEDFVTKLARPESRTIVGSYTRKSIPFRSASFSQADLSSGKYVKTDIASLKASLTESQSKAFNRSSSPPPGNLDTEKKKEETKANNPLKSEISIVVEKIIDSSDFNETSSNRNSDIETIAEEPMAESFAEYDEHIKHSENKIAQINVVQASEMMLETLIEEEPSAMSISAKLQTNQLQQATTCLIPIPVFECVEKEWIPLPEHGGEEFCHPISQDVLPQAKVIENTIEIHVSQSKDGGRSLDESDTKINSFNNPISNAINPSIPEVELNNVSIQLDEITEKLKETASQVEICNCVKTQIPQSKELETQKSVDSAEEIRFSIEIHEVLATVAETLNEEHKFLTNSIGNASINLASLICPDQDLATSDRGTPESIKIDLLKAADSSPEPGSFDKSDSELSETVRKRFNTTTNNDITSGNEKSSTKILSIAKLDDRRKIDKTRRRKGIYIQWPAVERSQNIETFDSSTVENTALTAKQSEKIQMNEPIKISEKKLNRSRNLGFSFSEPAMPRQSDPQDAYTPDSDCTNSNKLVLWPKSSRRQSLTYQSSDEREDPISAHSPPLKPFSNIFIRSDSISDNESDRGSSRDRTNVSPGDQDLRRYSKRPLRGPYGQMLEAEMKKPTKVHYDGILEELVRSGQDDSVKKSNCSLNSMNDSKSSRAGNGFLSRVGKSRKSGCSLPVTMHQRTVSSPVPLIETTCPDTYPISHKRYPSSVDYRPTVTDLSDHISFKHDTKKLSLDSYLSVEKSPKRTSSDTSDKHSKKNFHNEKLLAKRSLDEIRMPTASADQAEKHFILNTPETPKNMTATPELLAELLKGSSEKLLNEQNHSKKHHSHRNSNNNGSSLPTPVLNSLNSLSLEDTDDKKFAG